MPESSIESLKTGSSDEPKSMPESSIESLKTGSSDELKSVEESDDVENKSPSELSEFIKLFFSLLIIKNYFSFNKYFKNLFDHFSKKLLLVCLET